MRYKANNRYNTTLTAAFDGTTDVVMKVKSLPEFLPTIVTISFGNSVESSWIVTGKTGTDTLTGVSLLKGTAQTYYEGTTVDCVNWAEFYNQYFDVSTFFLAEDNTDYSTWGNEYALLISDDTFDLVRGSMLAFQPNQTNTDAVTVKINDLDPIALTKNGGSPLAEGDIIANQIITIMYDGESLQLMSVKQEEIDTTFKDVPETNVISTAVNKGCRFQKTMTVDTTFTVSATDGDYFVLKLTFAGEDSGEQPVETVATFTGVVDSSGEAYTCSGTTGSIRIIFEKQGAVITATEG